MDSNLTSAAALREALVAARRSDGGWGYYPGKAARLEPTCWALLALHSSGRTFTSAPLPPSPSSRGAFRPGASLDLDAAFLRRCQRADGWLTEDPAWPVNIGFNALTAFLWHVHPPYATDAARSALVAALTREKGRAVPPSEFLQQDNALQGWPWMADTFSWVEPTSLAVIALKKAGVSSSGEAAARVAEAERLLLDRACASGGWNYGNPRVMQQDLRPQVPPTACALLALRARASEPAVARGLAYLEGASDGVRSPLALALTVIVLRAYGRLTDAAVARLASAAPDAIRHGNLHAMAVALAALALTDETNDWRL